MGHDKVEVVSSEAIDQMRHRGVRGVSKFAVVFLTCVGILLVANKIFNLGLTHSLLESEYLYCLAGLFLAVTSVIFPGNAKNASNSVPWYDCLLAAASLIVSGYFAATAHRSLLEGWEYDAPQTATVMAFLLYGLVLEGVRRTGGLVILGVVVALSLFPVVASNMPGPISGFSQPLPETLVFHFFSSESAFGIPMKAFGQIVIGFIIFGAALQHTGGGKFFNDLAILMVGRYRGGAAKVSIFASGFMGSMSGSVISNVLTTGSISIPAMKRTGFSARYAAATEACASTGGVLMPPVMGSTAFVMASFTNMPYSDIVIAAAIPSILFYFGLFVQIDAYSGRKDLTGLEEDEIPRFREIISEGWQYILVFAVLFFMMMWMRRETQAPFYATGLLLVLNQLSARTRLNLSKFGDLLVGIGSSLSELVALLLGVGMIVGAFSATGLAGTIVNDLVFLAGSQTLPLLLMGAITAFVFGMGMTVTACYIFLAIVLAPALTQLGIDKVAIHLFILYWGMVSFITPPVAMGAFAAASLAGVGPMSVAVTAMRMGSIIYVLPFLFVLNPSLVAQGDGKSIALSFIAAVCGVFCIGAALQGYLARIGKLRPGAIGLTLRFLLFASGILIAFSPAPLFDGYHILMLAAGLVGTLIVAVDTWVIYDLQSMDSENLTAPVKR